MFDWEYPQEIIEELCLDDIVDYTEEGFYEVVDFINDEYNCVEAQS